MKIGAITCWQGNDVGAALRQTLATPPRRAGHFAELALLGAAQCATGLALPFDTAVIIASESGNLQQAEALVREVVLEQTAPMPFAFIASQSGAACQIISRQLELHGPAMCLSSTRAAFERALLYAQRLIEHGDAAAALVGWAEEAQADSAAGISHWLYLASTQAQGKALTISAHLSAEQALERVKQLTAVDVDTDAGHLRPGRTPIDESQMAHRLTEHWNAGKPYGRVRRLDDGTYLVLALTH